MDDNTLNEIVLTVSSSLVMFFLPYIMVVDLIVVGTLRIPFSVYTTVWTLAMTGLNAY